MDGVHKILIYAKWRHLGVHLSEYKFPAVLRHCWLLNSDCTQMKLSAEFDQSFFLPSPFSNSLFLHYAH